MWSGQGARLGAGLAGEHRIALALEDHRVLDAALPMPSWPRPMARGPPNTTVLGTELGDKATWDLATHAAAPDTTNAAPVGPAPLPTAWPYHTPSHPAYVPCPVKLMGMQEMSKLKTSSTP